jgi:tetratricopeptide (TPR) repeat protein
MLLRELGGYALGIELAGAFLGTYPSESAASYLELLRQTSGGPEREMTGRVRYERTVDDALRATWDRLEISERNAWLIAACFEPEPVSRALAEAAGLDAAARRSLERRHLLRSAQNGRWVMHRLIRDFGLRAGSEGERREALERFVRGCFAGVSEAGTSGSELYSGDWPHLDSALRRASEVLDPDSEVELVFRHLWPLLLRKCFADDSKVFARIARIAESRGDYHALLGVFQWWFASVTLRADWKAAEDLAVSVLGLAQRQHLPEYRFVGRTISGTVALQTGDLRGSLLHFEPAIASLEQDESMRSVGAGALLLSMAAQAALLRGQPARAQVLSNEAARHPLPGVDVAASAMVSGWRVMLDQMCGNVEDVIRRGERALKVAVEHHIPVVAWQARVVLAWAGFTRDASTGLRALGVIREALGALQELSLNVPQLLAVGVEVAAGVGEHRAAVQLGQNALRMIQRTNSSIMEAEVWRQLASVVEDRDARLEYLERAIAIAEKQGATWWSLRAMIDRVNVVEVQKRPEAIAALREVYDRFREGHELVVLIKAKGLLSSPVP